MKARPEEWCRLAEDTAGETLTPLGPWPWELRGQKPRRREGTALVASLVVPEAAPSQNQH